MKTYNELLEIQSRFQPLINDQPLLFTYIAPKRASYHQIFMLAVADAPGDSYAVIPTNSNVVKHIINGLKIQDQVELTIYVRTDDRASNLVAECTLEEYIQKYKLDFKM